MFECLGDSDFLAKLHCIRQAFQVKSKESDLSVLLSLTYVALKRSVCNYRCFLLLLDFCNSKMGFICKETPPNFVISFGTFGPKAY